MSSSWQDDQLHALLSIRCPRELVRALVGITRELGFDNCAYGLRMPVPVSRPKIVMFNNYPAAWQARYRERNFLDVDPTVHHGMRSLLPLVWTDEVFASTPELWEEARSFGLQVGWAQSSLDANGVGGMLTLARSGEALSDLEMQDKGLRMAWLAQVGHLGMSRCLAPELLPDAEIRLTKRELAVLRWTGDGKTSGEIAEILRISERTVNFHVRNAVTKLGTTNKLAATVKAAMLGMLY